MKRRTVDVVRVFPSPLDRRLGRIVAGNLVLRCALGRSGALASKREGDGGTPRGRFALLGGYYRPDRLRRPRTGLALRPLRPNDGWCDDPGDRRYNRPIRLPARARHEAMWRQDHLYDIVLDIAANRRPVVRARGSAIFLHLARPGFLPTEGCVAIERRMAQRLLAVLGRRTRIEIR